MLKIKLKIEKLSKINNAQSLGTRQKKQAIELRFLSGKFLKWARINFTLTPIISTKQEAVMRKIISGCLLMFLVIGTGCSQEKPATWDDIKNLNLRVTLDGVDFNEPLHYHAVFARDPSDWPEISSKIRGGKERNVVDNVIVYALLPDLEPVTEKNKNDFTVLGWGRKLDAYITHPRSWEYYFKYTAPKRLERLPDDPQVLNMLHYKDNITHDEYFLSHDHAVPELTRIRCPSWKSGDSPYCEVETQYRHEINQIKNNRFTPFYLNYSFSRTYLPQWREIDRKLKALYDQFAQSAEKQP